MREERVVLICEVSCGAHTRKLLLTFLEIYMWWWWRRGVRVRAQANEQNWRAPS